MFWQYVGSLQLLVQWYNTLKQTVLEVEFPLIRAELADLDLELGRAETALTWKHPDSWSFIQATKHVVQNLQWRVQRTKDNCDAIQTLMKGWSKQALFCRKDNRRDALLQLDDRSDRVSKRYSATQKDGCTIHKLIQVNMFVYMYVYSTTA